MRVNQINDGLLVAGGLVVESVELASGFGNFWYPLNVSLYDRLTYLGRVCYHHVAVHEDVLDVVTNTAEDWSTHGDVGDKVTVI